MKTKIADTYQQVEFQNGQYVTMVDKISRMEQLVDGASLQYNTLNAFVYGLNQKIDEHQKLSTQVKERLHNHVNGIIGSMQSENATERARLQKQLDDKIKEIDIDGKLTAIARDVIAEIRFLNTLIKAAGDALPGTLKAAVIPVSEAINDLAAKMLTMNTASIAERNIVSLLANNAIDFDFGIGSNFVKTIKQPTFRPYVWTTFQNDMRKYFSDPTNNEKFIMTLKSGEWAKQYGVSYVLGDALSAMYLRFDDLIKKTTDTKEKVYLQLVQARLITNAFPGFKTLSDDFKLEEAKALVTTSTYTASESIERVMDDYLNSILVFDTQKDAFQSLMKMAFQRMYTNAEALKYFQNILLIGPPGTGKTTLAQCYYNWLKALHLVSGKFIAISGRTLVGGNAADSSFLVRYYMYLSLTNVLFIDEAYTLCSYPPTPAQKTAVDELVYYLDQFKGIQTVIFGGYKDRMMEVYECNPGLMRRIPHTIELKLPTDAYGYTRAAILSIVRTDIPAMLQSVAQLYTGTDWATPTKGVLGQMLQWAARVTKYWGPKKVDEVMYCDQKLFTTIEKHLAKVHLLGYGVIDVVQKHLRLAGMMYMNAYATSNKDVNQPVASFTGHCVGNNRWLLTLPSRPLIRIKIKHNDMEFQLRPYMHEENGYLVCNFIGENETLKIQDQSFENNRKFYIEYDHTQRKLTLRRISKLSVVVYEEEAITLGLNSSTKQAATHTFKKHEEMITFNDVDVLTNWHFDEKPQFYTFTDTPEERKGVIDEAMANLDAYFQNLSFIDQELFHQRVRKQAYDMVVEDRGNDLGQKVLSAVIETDQGSLGNITKNAKSGNYY